MLDAAVLVNRLAAAESAPAVAAATTAKVMWTTGVGGPSEVVCLQTGEGFTMGVSFGVLAYGAGERTDVFRPEGDADAGVAAAIINPRTRFRRDGQVDMLAGGRPDRGDLNIAGYDDGWLIATADARKFLPHQLPSRYLKPALGSHVVSMMQDSVYDIFSFGRWRNGSLLRWLCVNRRGVFAEAGEPEKWEAPFWRGDHRDADLPASLPFHPLDMASVASQVLFGVIGEGFQAVDDVRSIDEVILAALRKQPSPSGI